MEAKTIKDFDELLRREPHHGQKKRIAVAWAADTETQTALYEALQRGMADVCFVGACGQLRSSHLFDDFGARVNFVEAADEQDACCKTVRLAREGKADIVMKGLVHSDSLLRAVLSKTDGLLAPGHVLTHMAVAELRNYPKLLFYTDAAVIPYPTDEQRMAQVRYMADTCHRLGIAEPRIALIHCSEKVDGKHFPYTLGFAPIKEAAARGEFGPCIVDGPLDLKTSCDAGSMRVKGIHSPIAGETDVLIFPDIEAGNLFHKTITLFCGAKLASLLVGTSVPVVFTSRSDSAYSKLTSIAVAINL